MSKVDLKKSNEKKSKNKLSFKHKRDTKLQELEKQLEFAECRCGTLKQQLDYIKILYGNKKLGIQDKRLQRDIGHGDASSATQFNFTDFCPWNATKPSADTSENGRSVSFAKSEYPNDVLSSLSSDQQSKQKSELDLKKKLITKPKNHLKVNKIKKKLSKRGKNKLKKEPVSIPKVSSISIQTVNQTWQDPVVEIYKNTASNVESESGFDVVSKKNFLLEKKELDQLKEKSEDLSKVARMLNLKKVGSFLKEEGMQTDDILELTNLNNLNNLNNDSEVFNKEPLKSDNGIFEPVKNYCQPTISSRKKQVERDVYSNLTNLNIKNIPFIAAKSTAPSHNIGVNIQQVFSIIKKRQRLNDNFPGSVGEGDSLENTLGAILHSKKTVSSINEKSKENTALVPNKQPERVRSNLSHWISNSDLRKNQVAPVNKSTEEEQQSQQDWTFKVNKLKKVLVFLHEDFTNLSQKYKRLQKKLTKRNISKAEAKDELADIERNLEKKEEEITVVVGLYKEVINLREDFKKLQDKYNCLTSGRIFSFEGLKQSASAHTQMTSLLRKIQNLQDQLKG